MKLAKGDLITYAKPFAYCLSVNYKGNRCDTCLESNPSLKRCVKCKMALYCNKECQVAGWKDHKHECSYFVNKGRPFVQPSPDQAFQHNIGLVDMVILLVRVIHKLRNGGYNQTVTVGNVTRCFNDLKAHDDVKGDADYSFKSVLSCLAEFMESDVKPLPMGQLRTLAKQVYISVRVIRDYESGEEIGFGIYLELSAFKHSCRPNAFFVFDGPNMILRSAEDHEDFNVAKVFVAYQVDALQLKAFRQKELRDRFLFDCKCAWCKDDVMDKQMMSMLCDNVDCEAPVYIHDDKCEKCKTLVNPKKRIEVLKVLDELGSALSSAKKMVMCDHISARDAQVHRALNIFTDALKDAERLLHPLNLGYVKCAAKTLLVYSLVWSKTNGTVRYPLGLLQTYARVAMDGSRMYHGSMNPDFVFSLSHTGKIYCFNGLKEEGKTCMQEAVDTMSTLFGEKSMYVQRYKGLAQFYGSTPVSLLRGEYHQFR